MSLIPWRRQNEGSLALQDEFDELWKAFNDPFNGFQRRLPVPFEAKSFPPMNVSESEHHLTVTLELPGMDAKDVTIEMMGNQLSITGERKWEDEKKGKEYHRVESQYGKFSRTLTLPENLRLDRESIVATFQKGILEIRVPKVEPTPAAKIPIQSK